MLAATEAAEAAAANAKFRAFFEQGMNFAGVLALDGTVVEANRLCLDACGFTRDEVIGKPFWECGWWNRSARPDGHGPVGLRPGGRAASRSGRSRTTSWPPASSGWST